MFVRPFSYELKLCSKTGVLFYLILKRFFLSVFRHENFVYFESSLTCVYTLADRVGVVIIFEH